MSGERLDVASERRTLRASVLNKIQYMEILLFKLEYFVVIASMAVILAGITFSVVVRIAGLNLKNYAELSIAAMSPLTFVGAAICTYLHRHISIDVIELLPSQGVKLLAGWLSAIMMAVFSVYFMALSWGTFEFALMSGERLTDVGTPVSVPMGFIVAGGALMLFHSVCDLIRLSLNAPRSGLVQ